MRWLSNKMTTRAQRGVPARILFWLAVVMVIAWLLARWWGITDDQTITRGQRKLLIAAGVLFLLSWLPLPRFPNFVRLTLLALPTRFETFILALLATLIVTIDIFWSSSAGLLAYPPSYDGIGYMFDSKRTLYLLSSLFENPEVLRNSSAPDFSFSPLWKILIMIHYLVLGIGEWQAYTVRFWPTFLLLFIIHWMVRKESNGRIAWMAVAFTAMLPTLSVSIRASVLQFDSRMIYASGWYLTDLRPDLLFAVLLLWATAPLVQYVNNLDSLLWLISGAAAALALMTKPSAFSLLVLAWGLAFVVVLVVNRATLRETLSTSIWGFGSFLFIVIPWMAFGGLARIFRYVYRSAVSQRELWSDANATLWSEVTYYWHWFSVHMGQVEGWLFLACGLIGFVLRLNRKTLRRNIASCAYLIIAIVLYGIVSASPSKNYFLGLPFFLILWIFSWMNLSQMLNVAADRSRIVSSLPAIVATLYIVLNLSTFWYAVRNWPAEHIQAATQTRAATQQIVGDLNKILIHSDKFLSAPLFGIPATFHFYMIRRDGSYPRQCPFDPLASPPERVVEKLGGDCKAILLYSSNADQRSLSPAPRAALMRWEAVAEWVKNPRSGYRLVKGYQFSSQSPGSSLDSANGSFTMELYVLDTPASSGVGS